MTSTSKTVPTLVVHQHQEGTLHRQYYCEQGAQSTDSACCMSCVHACTVFARYCRPMGSVISVSSILHRAPGTAECLATAEPWQHTKAREKCNQRTRNTCNHHHPDNTHCCWRTAHKKQRGTQILCTITSGKAALFKHSGTSSSSCHIMTASSSYLLAPNVCALT